MPPHYLPSWHPPPPIKHHIATGGERWLVASNPGSSLLGRVVVASLHGTDETDSADVCNPGTRINEMSMFPKDANTVRKGMEHLWMVSVNAEKQKRIGNFKGGCKALISALQVGKYPFPGCHTYARTHARTLTLSPPRRRGPTERAVAADSCAALVLAESLEGQDGDDRDPELGVQPCICTAQHAHGCQGLVAHRQSGARFSRSRLEFPWPRGPFSALAHSHSPPLCSLQWTTLIGDDEGGGGS